MRIQAKPSREVPKLHDVKPGCRSDKAKFAHNRRLDFAVREALLSANPASHVKLKGQRASSYTTTTVPICQGYH